MTRNDPTFAPDAPLAEGPGICPATFEADIAIPVFVAQTGNPPAFISRIFRGVHSWNRHAAKDDYVGIALVDYAPRREGARKLGRRFTLVGSETALRSVLTDPAILDMTGERPLATIRPRRPLPEGAEAWVLTRDRRWEKASLGNLKRKLRRLERRGNDTKAIRARIAALEASGDRIERNRFLGSDLRIPVAKTILGLSMRKVEATGAGEIRVTGYGLSCPDAPLAFFLAPQETLPAHVLQD